MAFALNIQIAMIYQLVMNVLCFSEWEQSYETARYNQYSTYVQEYLNSTCVNGHHVSWPPSSGALCSYLLQTGIYAVFKYNL